MSGFPLQQPVVGCARDSAGANSAGADEQAEEDSRELRANFTGSTFHRTFLNEPLQLNVQNCD